ncbi:MAG: squalene/phytoene synthase family protein [Thermoanaerobaculia bacterium]|nr:squalene/phytoene synthase family protein [Thermoanaerobaculia bacterium]
MSERNLAVQASRPAAGPRLDDERLYDLLEKTSRTFALAIPLLPPPTVREVTIAYLLFRIADTFEDASVFWSRPRQRRALEEFEHLLEEPSDGRGQELVAGWLAEPPTDHEGYLELLRETPGVLAAWRELSPAAREIVGEHTRRTAALMAEFVERSDDRGVLRLESEEDLERYCYAVAGIVGEMLTELFLLDRPELESVADDLRRRAAAFGEGLQLVNILRDSASDRTEGRNYLPEEVVPRAEVFARARRDLEAAAEYTLALQRAGGPDGVVSFTAVPILLARATLEAVEEEGPGAKITREQVYALYHGVLQALEAGRPVVETG